MYDIEHCGCREFGTHWEICDTCGHLEKGYNSCRNRHCPGCNNIARRRWGAARIDELLPVSSTPGAASCGCIPISISS